MNTYKVDFVANTITITAAFAKAMNDPTSAEYKALMKLMKQNPTFTVAEKEIKKAEGKNTYKGLDKAFVEKYISIQDNADDLNKQYAKASEMGKFPLVRKWFLNTFKNFDMAAAKEEIEQAIFAEIAAATEKKSAVLTMAEMKSAS